MPGVGKNMYGGFYYEGQHKYNIRTTFGKGSCCPMDPRFSDWVQEGMRWLFKEFNIGGANVANGDFLVCGCPQCKEYMAKKPEGEPMFWHFQTAGYDPALRAIEDQLKDKLVVWATYKGFLASSGETKPEHQSAYIGCERPAAVDKLSKDAISQWTLTGMVRKSPLPLTAYLDNGSPNKGISSKMWPENVKPPTVRSSGFLHQGSQWTDCPNNEPRYRQVVSSIKEGCLRAYRAGLEGVSIHGEVSSMHIPWALNYLAFSHFIHWPEDSMRQFGRKTLNQVLGSEDEGELFAEMFSHYDAGTLTEKQKKVVRQKEKDLRKSVQTGMKLINWWFWYWLTYMVFEVNDKQTVSII